MLGVEDGWRGGAGACCFAAVIFEMPRLFSVYSGAIMYELINSIMNIHKSAISSMQLNLYISMPG